VLLHESCAAIGKSINQSNLKLVLLHESYAAIGKSMNETWSSCCCMKAVRQ
jgi:hypothetical protein